MIHVQCIYQFLLIAINIHWLVLTALNTCVWVCIWPFYSIYKQLRNSTFSFTPTCTHVPVGLSLRARGLGISSDYYEHGPCLLSEDNRRKNTTKINPWQFDSPPTCCKVYLLCNLKIILVTALVVPVIISNSEIEPVIIWM